MDQRLLTHEQAAELLGVSVGTLRALVRDGVLADLRVGRHHRVLAQEAAILGVSQSTIESWSIAGRLPFTTTVGVQRRYREQDVRRLSPRGLARTD